LYVTAAAGGNAGRRLNPTVRETPKAREAYEKARERDPNDVRIELNYDLFRELHDRTHGQDSR
jgi:hypothetical protein